MIGVLETLSMRGDSSTNLSSCTSSPMCAAFLLANLFARTSSQASNIVEGCVTIAQWLKRTGLRLRLRTPPPQTRSCGFWSLDCSWGSRLWSAASAFAASVSHCGWHQCNQRMTWIQRMTRVQLRPKKRVKTSTTSKVALLKAKEEKNKKLSWLCVCLTYKTIVDDKYDTLPDSNQNN